MLHHRTPTVPVEPVPDPLIDDDYMSPGLPAGVYRDSFISTLCHALCDELTPAQERILRVYAEATSPAHWTEPGPAPVCFLQKRKVAERTGLNESTILEAENRFEVLGLVIKDALDNGHRVPAGRTATRRGVGLCFAPMIRRCDEIMRRSRRIEADIAHREMRRSLCSSKRFALRRALHRAPEGDAVDQLRRAFSNLPKAIRSLKDIALIEEIICLLDDLRRQLSELSKAGGCSVETPDASPENSRQHRYSTTETPSVPCRTMSADADAKKEGGDASTPPEVATDAPVVEAGTSRAPITWRLQQLIDIASEDFLAALAQVAQVARSSGATQADLSHAAERMCHYLGIHPSAWDDACCILGEADATLAILIIARNRTHPTHPVRSPGGVLRGMIRKALIGELDLDASLFAIIGREGER